MSTPIWPPLEATIEFAPGVPTNVTADVRRLTSRIGRDTELAGISPGDGLLVLANNERQYEPTHADGPHFGNLKSGRKVLVRAGWANALGNSMFLENLAFWQPTGATPATITWDPAKFLQGFSNATMKVACDGAAANQGARDESEPACAVGQTWTGYVWAEGAGTVQARLEASDALDVVQESHAGDPVVLSSAWQQVKVTATLTDADSAILRLYVETTSAQAVTFHVGAAFLGQFGFAPPFVAVPGGLGGILAGWTEGQPIAYQGRRSEVAFLVRDGFRPLELAKLPATEPPAESHADVVQHDRPFGYWRLSDPRTATKVEAAVGPEGVYKVRGLVTLQQEGAIIGDTDKAVRVRVSGSDEGRAHIPMAATEYLSDGQALTVEVWAKMEAGAGNRYVVTGPVNNGFAQPIWQVELDNNFGGTVIFEILDSTGTYTVAGVTGLNVGQWYHIVGTFGGGVVRLYLDGVLVDEENAPPIVAPTAGNPLIISDTAFGFVGTIDEVAVYEHALPADRVLAHYISGAARGFVQERTGDRVDNVLDIVGLWPTDRLIDAGKRMILPVRQYGQPPGDAIAEAVAAEQGLFWFDLAGRPTFLDRAYRLRYPYYTSHATFGFDSGDLAADELPYVGDPGSTPQDETLLRNRWEVTRREGTATAVAFDQDSIDDHFERTESVTDIPVLDDTAAQEIADDGVHYFAQPHDRIETLALNPRRDERLWNPVLAFGLQYGLTVKLQPPYAATGEPNDPVLLPSRIEQIAHDVELGDRRRWTTTYRLSPVESLTPFIIGRSVLDGPDVLIYGRG